MCIFVTGLTYRSQGFLSTIVYILTTERVEQETESCRSTKTSIYFFFFIFHLWFTFYQSESQQRINNKIKNINIHTQNFEICFKSSSNVNIETKIKKISSRSPILKFIYVPGGQSKIESPFLMMKWKFITFLGNIVLGFCIIFF